MNDFAVQVTRDGQRQRITVDGDLDLSSAEGLAALGLTALADDLIGRVEIDLFRVSFIDSTGLSQLIAVHKAAEAQGKSMVLRSPSLAVQRLLELTGTYDVFNLVALSAVEEHPKPA